MQFVEYAQQCMKSDPMHVIQKCVIDLNGVEYFVSLEDFVSKNNALKFICSQ